MSTGNDADHELEPADAARRVREEGWQLIDVREPYEREAGHIADSRHIEFSQLAAQAETVDRDRPVIFQCRVGNRSAVAVEAFRGAGYDAYSLSGGLVAWVEAGLPIEPEDGEVAPH
jgi:rhodanese-related sulfurtransferase